MMPSDLRPGLLFACALTGWTCLIGGCAILGPAAIGSGRSAYSEVINRTGDEQFLNMIVRERYGETFGMLEVASVTASMRFRGNIGAEFGVGSDASYAGNLVPLSAGAAYEENPTISYVPLEGEAFLTKMLAPITLDQAILLSRAAENSPLLSVMVRSINGWQNPALRSHRSSPEFDRIVELHGRLRSLGMLSLVRDKATGGSDEATYYYFLHGYTTAVELVEEFLVALGIDATDADGREIYVPIHLSVGRTTGGAVNLELRSVIDVIRDVSAAVEVPAEHIELGIAEPNLSEAELEPRILVVKASKDRPRLATVAIQAHGYWFYVDATDTRSKEGFRMLRTLVGIRLDADGTSPQVPVLTIPTGG